MTKPLTGTPAAIKRAIRESEQKLREQAAGEQHTCDNNGAACKACDKFYGPIIAKLREQLREQAGEQ